MNLLKNILILLFIITLLSACEEVAGPTGVVNKKIIKTESKYYKHSPDEQKQLVHRKIFDLQGNLISEFLYDNNRLTSQSVFTYSHDRFMEEKINFTLSETPLKEFILYRVNGEKVMAKFIMDSEKRIKIEERFEYDSFGSIVRHELINKSSEIEITAFENIYDSGELVLRYIDVKDNGQYDRKDSIINNFNYDKTVKRISYSSDNTMTEIMVYHYNNIGIIEKEEKKNHLEEVLKVYCYEYTYH